ncbi:MULTISPECIES: spore protease YyaC [unclassified Clostridium]|uniref:spore protease YyaC n=1 Tax=unclassified Clostridium TaxID=2614128 RepID=UPI0025C08687|nr:MULTISPECIES: spore protease YyaC [unclassified Clostridium]
MVNKMIFDSLSHDCIYNIRETLIKEIIPIIKSNRDIVILCIGTDRSTGDSLGPLVGEKLKFLIRNKVHIYGNLENPVHAKNLVETIENINTLYPNAFIIAVDASLGSLSNVGKVIIESKPLNPGSALNKDLPAVGDLSITGIVNISGALEFMVLQNTRLYIVMKLADVIASGIYHCILKAIGGKKFSNIEDENEIDVVLKKIEI